MSSPLYQQWLKIAVEDHIVAKLVLDEEHFAHACFLSQQCIEKSLKAFLIEKSNQYPRVHNLVDLLTLCIAIDNSFAQFLTACSLVDRYYIPTRYPSGIPGGLSYGPPSKKQAQQAIDFAKEIYEHVEVQLKSNISGGAST